MRIAAQAIAGLCLLVASAAGVCAPAASGAVGEPFELDARFQRLKGQAVGVLVVEQVAQRCMASGHARCNEAFARLRKQAGLHPLVAQALDRRIALGRRVAGQREEAVKTAGGLGFIRSWRVRTPGGEEVELPADPVSGEVRGSDFLEFPPGEPVRVWADLESRSECLVAMRLAAADLSQTCVDGSCLVRPSDTRSFWDQHVVPVRLAAGVTRVELKFEPLSGPVKFVARLTQLDGASLPLGSLEGRTQVQGVCRPGKVDVSEVRTSLEGLPEGNEKLLLSCFFGKETGRPDDGDGIHARVAAARLGPLSEWLEAFECLEGAPVLLDVLERGGAAWPANPEVTLARVVYMLRTGRSLDSLELLRGLCPDERFGCLTPPQEVRAALAAREPLAQSGLAFLVEEILRRALARAGSTPALISALSEVLSEQERYREAADLVGGYLKEWPGDYEMAATQLFLLEKLGGAGEEVQLAERLNWLFPVTPFLRHVLASSLGRAGERARASEVYGSLEAWIPFHPYLLDQAAQFHYSNGERDRALALWKRVLKLRPQDRSLRGLLARLQSEGGVSRPRFSDADIRKMAEAIQGTGAARLAGVMDSTFVEAHANRAWQLERWVAVKAIAPVEAGYLDLGVAYDSFLEEATVLRSAVLRADGNGAVQAIPYGDVGLSEGEFNLYYDMRQVSFSVPELLPGDVVVVAWLVESSPSPLRTPFSGIVWLQEDYPKSGALVEVQVPPDTDLFCRAGPEGSLLSLHQEVTARSEGTVHRFRFGPIPALSAEPLGQGRFQTAVHFQYSTLATWEDFARWYAPVVSPLSGGDAAMKSLVRRLSEEAGGDRTLLTEAICRYVADEVRYVGLDFGVHGLKPYAPAEVFRRGFGDCKDKSLLLVTLLAEAGIPAHVVTASTLSMGAVELDPGAPTPYDHAIAYLDEPDVYFDPTARFVGLGLLPWQVEGASGVVIDPVSPRKVQFGESRAEDNRSALTVSISAGEPMSFAATLQFTGQFVWRVLQVAENRGAWETELESYLADYLPGADIEDIQEDLLPGPVPELNVTLTGSWALPGAALKVTPDLDALDRSTTLPERKQPLQFGYAYVQEVRLEFAPGTVRMPVGVFHAVQEEDAAFVVQVEALPDGGSVLGLRLEQKSRTVPVERYAAFRRLVQQLRAAVAAVEGVADAN